MNVSATLRSAHVSSRKAGLAAGLVRGLSAQDAVKQLKFSTLKASRLLATLLSSAVANAENVHGLDPATLKVKEVLVGSAGMIKRFQPRAFGRAFPIRHRLCHMTVTLTGDPVAKKKPAVLKAAKATQPASAKKALASSAAAKRKDAVSASA